MSSVMSVTLTTDMLLICLQSCLCLLYFSSLNLSNYRYHLYILYIQLYNLNHDGLLQLYFLVKQLSLKLHFITLISCSGTGGNLFSVHISHPHSRVLR